MIDEECNIKICDFGLARTLPESCTGKGSGNTKRVRDGLHKGKTGLDYDQIVQFEEDQKYKIAEKIKQSKHGMQEKKRSLSSHVGSRWYRAPEIMLCEEQYDQAQDMWGVGCIIHEILLAFSESGLKGNQTKY